MQLNKHCLAALMLPCIIMETLVIIILTLVRKFCQPISAKMGLMLGLQKITYLIFLKLKKKICFSLFFLFPPFLFFKYLYSDTVSFFRTNHTDTPFSAQLQSVLDCFISLIHKFLGSSLVYCHLIVFTITLSM